MTKRSLYTLIFSSIFVTLCNGAHAAVDANLINTWLHKDGYIVLSDPVKLDTLDSRLSINAHSKFILPLIFESLITINAEQELKPVLAKSWHITPDKKSITVTLKSGHHFSDNTEVTAEDVVKSVYRLCGKGSQESGQLRGLLGCEEYAKYKKAPPQVYAIGKYDVKFNIDSSATTFLYRLSSPSAVIVKQTPSGLIGSGVYIIQEKTPNYLILSKNKFYSDDIKAKNSGIVFIYISNHDAVNTLTQKKLDGALMYRMEELWNFQDSNYKLIKSNPNITKILVLNNQRFPFNKPIVRKALAAEIYNHFDYSCMPGAHKPYGIIPSGVGGSLANMSPSTMPEITAYEVFQKVPSLKHKKISVVIHQLYDVKSDCESNQIIQAAKKYNIAVTFKYHQDYSDLAPLYANHNLDGFMDLFIFKNREASNIFEFFEKGGENDANINQSNIDKMLKEAVSTSSSHGRFQIYKKLAQYMQDENISIPLYYMDHGNLMSKCLSGISEDFFFNPFLELPELSKTKNCNKL